LYTEVSNNRPEGRQLALLHRKSQFELTRITFRVGFAREGTDNSEKKSVRIHYV